LFLNKKDYLEKKNINRKKKKILNEIVYELILIVLLYNGEYLYTPNKESRRLQYNKEVKQDVYIKKKVKRKEEK